MALKNLIEWNKERAVSACGAARGLRFRLRRGRQVSRSPIPDGSRRSVCRDRFCPFLRARPIPDIQRGPAK